jgi:UDP-glucose:(heptosyl)LPS alpha-1,3-glucosyltransferase
MKLAFALFKYFPYGGLQRDCVKIAQECVARGHQVDMFALEASSEVPEPLTLTCLEVKAKINYKRYEEFAKLLQQHVHNEGYDAVVGFNRMVGLDFYYAADPCFAAKVEDRPRFYAFFPRTKSFLRAEEEVFSRHSSTHALLISPTEMNNFTRIYHTPSERMHLLPPGIQRDRIAPPDYDKRRRHKRNELGVAEGQSMLLMVGSGFKTKGADRSLHAIAVLPEHIRRNTHLFVVGQDNPRTFLKLARKLGIAKQVRFLGGRDDVPDLLFAADILLHPAYRENTGTVLLESVVAQLPVICTDTCGYSFHIRNSGMGVVHTSPFDIKRFSEEIVHTLDIEPDYWRQRAQEYTAKTDLSGLAKKAVDIIETKIKNLKHHRHHINTSKEPL